MTREIKFSTSSLQYTDPQEDCYLDPSDTVYEIMGHTSTSRVQALAQQHFELRDRAQQQGIRPGTPAWFALNQTK